MRQSRHRIALGVRVLPGIASVLPLPPPAHFFTVVLVAEMAEHTVFVREAGEEDFDIVYVSEKVTDASGESRPLSLEDLHQTIQDALGRYPSCFWNTYYTSAGASKRFMACLDSARLPRFTFFARCSSLFSDEEILKITLDNIAIRNANGLRFMFKKDEPKLEVTFTSTGAALSITRVAIPMFYSGSKQAAQAQEAQFQAPVVPVQAPQYSSSPVPPGSPAQNWSSFSCISHHI